MWSWLLNSGVAKPIGHGAYWGAYQTVAASKGIPTPITGNAITARAAPIHAGAAGPATQQRAAPIPAVATQQQVAPAPAVGTQQPVIVPPVGPTQQQLMPPPPRPNQQQSAPPSTSQTPATGSSDQQSSRQSVGAVAHDQATEEDDAKDEDAADDLAEADNVPDQLLHGPCSERLAENCAEEGRECSEPDCEALICDACSDMQPMRLPESGRRALYIGTLMPLCDKCQKKESPAAKPEICACIALSKRYHHCLRHLQAKATAIVQAKEAYAEAHKYRSSGISGALRCACRAVITGNLDYVRICCVCSTFVASPFVNHRDIIYTVGMEPRRREH